MFSNKNPRAVRRRGFCFVEELTGRRDELVFIYNQYIICNMKKSSTTKKVAPKGLTRHDSVLAASKRLTRHDPAGSKKALLVKSPYFNFLAFALKMQNRIHAKNNT